MKLQNYLFKIAERPYMFWVVMVLTICESIFLFIPTEVFMTPPIIAKKSSAKMIVLAASIGSLVGGTIAYLIGVFLFDTLGIWLINTFSSMEQFETAQGLFNTYGLLIVVLAAFSPVPYKLMSTVAGFLGYNILFYIGMSAIFRTARFALAGLLLWRFQEQANAIAKKYFWPLTLAAILAAIAGIMMVGML